MTQTELAGLVEVRFQQVQKYENGQNRVAASRLWQIAEALQVPIGYFFNDLLDTGADPDAARAQLETRRKREIATLFATLTETQQAAVLSFLRSLAELPAKT